MQYNCDSILYKSAPYKVQKCMKPLFMKHEAIFRGVFRDVTYFMEGPRCVTKCDKREGVSKLAKNSVTYFMDGPQVNCSLDELQFSTCSRPYCIRLIEIRKHSDKNAEC